jgi:membrane protease YdiL (CAAX protease family)
MKKSKRRLTVHHDRKISTLGTWLPDRDVFKENLSSFKLALILSLVMIAKSVIVIPFITKITSFSFRLLAGSLGYLFDLAVLLLFIFKIEKRSLHSIGLRVFQKNHVLFWREILWTTGLCFFLLSGIGFMPFQPSLQSMGTEKFILSGLYRLIFVALIEEMVWRGYVFSRFCCSLGKLLALALSLILMILWHLPYYLSLSSSGGTPLITLILGALSGTIATIALVLLTEQFIGRWNIYPAIFFHWFSEFGAQCLRILL